MAATKLVLFHQYRDDIAYDWSRHGNHGDVRDARNGPPSGLTFDRPSSDVYVDFSDSLRDFGELRIRVIFLLRPKPGVRRHELVEGHLAFALYRNEDASLQGTINTPTSAGWDGPLSAPGTVSDNAWHVADYTHDGISRARLHLDGTLIAERSDVPGPIPDLGPNGLRIGHWPEGDDYTMFGQLEQVQIWKHDPKADASRVVDDCCMDLDWIDARSRDARRRGWSGSSARQSFKKFLDDARAAAAEVRGGDPGRIAQINVLTQQTVGALATGHTAGVEGPLEQLLNLAVGVVGQARLEQIGHQLLDDLRATPVGDFIGTTDEELLAFAQELVDRTCLGDKLPPRPSGRGRDPHEPDDREHPPERIPERDPSPDTVGDLPQIPDPPLADETDPSWQPDPDDGEPDDGPDDGGGGPP